MERDFNQLLRDRLVLQQEYLGTAKPVNRAIPVVSVCVTTYQQQPYIAQALDSILIQQTSFPFEIVIGEDHSTDGTREICIDYANRYPDRIRLYLRDRSTTHLYENGIYVTRFNGKLTRMSARGKYLALCEGDDYWNDPLKLQKQVDYLEAHPDCVLSCHDACVVDTHGNRVETSRLKPEQRTDLTRDEMVISGYVLTLTMCFRNVIREYPPELANCPNGDRVVQALLSEHGHAHFQTSVTPACYRLHEGGMWGLQTQLHRMRQSILTYRQFSRYYLRVSKTMYHEHYANLCLEKQFVLYGKLREAGENQSARKLLLPILRFSLKHFGWRRALRSAVQYGKLWFYFLRKKNVKQP